MESNNDLEEIRARRLAEMQQQYAGNRQQSAEDINEKKAKEDELRHHILSQVLTQEARARLNTISLAKPDKGVMIENMLINMARMGQLTGKLQESQLINLLERLNEQTSRKTTVKFDRRRTALDDSDEDY